MQRHSSRKSDADVRRPTDHPHISGAELGNLSITDRGQGLSPGTEEVLLRIPGAIVHLIDRQESVQIAEGVFSLSRLTRYGRAIAVFASVGEDLRWPLTKDEPVNKLDRCHYLFTLKVPQQVEEGHSEEFESEDDPKILSYGVTLTDGSDQSQLKELDECLRNYSVFKVANIVQDERVNSRAERAHEKKGRLDSLEEFIFGTSTSSPNSKSSPLDVSSGDRKPESVDERSSAYWATMAPSVEEYNSSIAKGIANQSGTMIDGVLRCSKATVEQLQRGGDYVKARVKKKEKPTQISPRTMKNIRRVRKVSRMTDRVAKGVLAGIVTATGVVSGSVVTSRGGKEFFKLVPGEVALASLDAFGKVFDAVEIAGKSVLNSTSVVTSGVVEHRYGEEAGEASKEGMAALGHWLSTAWTVSKIRKAFNKPRNAKAGSTKRAVLKSALAGAATKQFNSKPS